MKKDVILLAVLALFTLGIGTIRSGSVTAFDERLYFSIAKEMYVHHELFIPPSTSTVLPGHIFDETATHLQPSTKLPAFYKGPLLYWFYMIAFSILGATPTAARLVNALFSVLAIVVTYLLAKELFDRKVGMLSALFLLSCIGFFQVGRSMLFDMTFASIILLGVYLCIFGISRNKTSSILGGMFVLGLSSLLKGPIGPFLGLSVLLGYCIIYKIKIKTYSSSFMVGALLIVGCILFYPVVVILRGYGQVWFQHFVIAENVGKFVLTRKPAWILFTSLLSYQSPWTFLFIASCIMSIRLLKTQKNLQFLTWAFLSQLFIFLLPAQRIDRYVLPSLPYTMIFMASMIEEYPRVASMRVARWITGVILVILGFLCCIVLLQFPTRTVWFFGISFFFFMLIAAYSIVRSRYKIGAIGVALSLSLLPFIVSLPSASKKYEAKAFLENKPSFGSDSSVDELFSLTGINVREVHAELEVLNLIPDHYFLVSEHELQDFPYLDFHKMHEVFFWYRWNPALRLSKAIKAIRTHNSNVMLERIMVFSPTNIRRSNI